MISALQEYARKVPQSTDASLVEMSSNFLEACHVIFEKGILSHMTISPKHQITETETTKNYSKTSQPDSQN